MLHLVWLKNTMSQTNLLNGNAKTYTITVDNREMVRQIDNLEFRQDIIVFLQVVVVVILLVYLKRSLNRCDK